jgi:ATP synthase mitochondrial F1 complex assembly factor 2
VSQAFYEWLISEGYQIKLDSRPLRTPTGNTILLPSSLSTLAHLIGAEWNVVTTGSVRQHTLPLTSLACRAIDHLTPNSPKEIRRSVIDSFIRYLDTDAVLFFAPEDQALGKLTKLQIEEWTPIINWAQGTFGVEIDVRPGEVGIGQFKKQPEETRERFREWLGTLDAFELAAFEKAVMTTKSFLLSTRLVMEYLEPEKCKGRYGVEGIAQLASLEVRFQTQMWGEVEDSMSLHLLATNHSP